MSVDARDKGFDYAACSFEVRLTKKKLFHSVLRYVYFAKDLLIEPYQKKPEKIITLHPRYTIKWLYQSDKQDKPFKERAIGFSLLNDKEEVITSFFGDNVIMNCLLEFLSKQIFQADFLQEYDIIQKIGKGKYAKVYKVRRKDNGEIFAVKYLHKRKMKDIDDSEAALDNEINILRLMDHPNCLKMVGCYQDAVGYYILTELLDETKSLQQEITKFKNPQFSYQIIKHILKQLLQGLEYVHSKGVMHRDLKPQNIMFASTQKGSLDHLKLIDFGLAQFVNESKYIYVHVGTPGYVAPEILGNEQDSHRYDEKCDLFSIGVIFHTLLTGKPVFPGTKFSQVLEKNKLCQIQLTGPKYEQINEEALDLLAQLLAKDPKRRISAANSLIHPFFEDKGIEVDRMLSCTETPLQNNVGREETILPKRPIKTQTSLKDCEFQHQATKGNIFEQLTSLKSMKEIDSNPQKLPSQAEALYRFTRDLLCILEDIEDNKEYLRGRSQDDDSSDSPLKLQQKGSILLSSPDQQGKKSLPIVAELKKIKETSLFHPIRVPECLEEEEEEDDDDEEQNQNKVNKNNEKPKGEIQENTGVKNIRKGLFIETKLGNKEETNGKTVTNPALEQKGEEQQKSLQQQEEYILPKFNKIKYPPKNMILNEMPSPISPPVNFKLSRPKIVLQADKLYSPEKPNGEVKLKFPKEVIQLIEYFPQDMFSCYLRNDKLEIEKGMKSRVFKLGLFLLFGEEVLKQPAPAQIKEKYLEISKKKKFESWFLDLINSMLIEAEEKRPSLKELSQKLLVQYPYPK